MNSQLTISLLLGCVFATVQGYAQDSKPPTEGMDLLSAAKYYACQANTDGIEIQRNIAKYITDSRHTFVMAPRDFLVNERKFSGVLFVEKPAGSLSVFSSQKIQGRVRITSEVKLPLQQDLSFIEDLYPVLAAQNTDMPDPDKNTRVKAYTTWYNLRFDGATPEAGGTEFAPLTKEGFLFAYTTMGYVEIDSVPPGARLTVVGHNGWKETRDIGFLPEGEVTIVLSKDGFKTTEAKEKIKVKGKNSFTYALQPAAQKP